MWLLCLVVAVGFFACAAGAADAAGVSAAISAAAVDVAAKHHNCILIDAT